MNVILKSYCYKALIPFDDHKIYNQRHDQRHDGVFKSCILEYVGARRTVILTCIIMMLLAQHFNARFHCLFFIVTTSANNNYPRLNNYKGYKYVFVLFCCCFVNANS